VGGRGGVGWEGRGREGRKGEGRGKKGLGTTSFWTLPPPLVKWLRLCAGISSGTAVFNQLAQSLFSEWLWSEVLTFLDDVTLPSRTVEEGIQLLSKVLDRLQTAGLKLKGPKCKLLQTQVKILGVIVSRDSMQEDPERAAVVKALEFPRTKREMRGFLGYVNFGRSFYKNLSEIMEPLTACLRKGG
jgi:hypothetical protein